MIRTNQKGRCISFLWICNGLLLLCDMGFLVYAIFFSPFFMQKQAVIWGFMRRDFAEMKKYEI